MKLCINPVNTPPRIIEAENVKENLIINPYQDARLKVFSVKGLLVVFENILLDTIGNAVGNWAGKQHH